MTKATESTKHEKRLAQYREAGLHLDQLLEAYAIGEREANSDLIAREIVGRYRQILVDKNLVNYDGPLYSDIKRALEAARMAGFRAGREKTNG